MIRTLVTALFFLAQSASLPAHSSPTPVDWQPWGTKAFAQARLQHKQVFLYLEAVWCHWCHVMQQDTLKNPEVLAELRANYIAVRVDHDADPLLAERFRNWGWPALIFLAPDGTEIVKRAGYIAPAPFTNLLKAIAQDPIPEEAESTVLPAGFAGAGKLTAVQRAALLRAYEKHDDPELGGLDTAQKFLDQNTLEYGLRLAARGDVAQKARVLRALDGARGLIDPVWGGVYQYSTHGDWTHPHYEKLMRVQARYLHLYSQAFALWQRAQDREAMQAIARYMLRFLRDDNGAFYVSQDADVVPGTKATAYFSLDDASRRRLGIPRVDKHLYADANGRAIAALAYYSDVTCDSAALDAAVRAAEWTLSNRAMGNGGFRHDATDMAGPYLSDALAMGGGLLALYRSTGQRRWLAEAKATSAFLLQTFRNPQGGFLSAVQPDTPVKPIVSIADNIAAVRWLNLMARYTAEESVREAALHGMKFLTSDWALSTPYEEAGILLADEESASDPAHFVVVGAKQDSSSVQMYATARSVAGGYARLEWWDRTEGPLMNADVPYPDFPKAAGYVCSNGTCSAPSFSMDVYRERARRAAAR